MSGPHLPPVSTGPMIRLFGRKKPDAPAERGDGAGRRKGGFTAEELAAAFPGAGRPAPQADPADVPPQPTPPPTPTPAATGAAEAAVPTDVPGPEADAPAAGRDSAQAPQPPPAAPGKPGWRSEAHTSELQSREKL